MIEALMHMLGICPDAHCHLNLFQLLAAGALTSCSAAGVYFRSFFRQKGT